VRWRLLAAGAVLCGPTCADEFTRPVVKGGDWAAVEFAPSETASLVACLAIDPTVEVALRADAAHADTELMVGNIHWDLPAAMEGTLKVTVGMDTRSFSITSNTNNIVSAMINPSIVPTLLDEMAKATGMRVVVGKTTPLKVSLAGSSVVLDAFRTCAAGLPTGDPRVPAAPRR
jgi:hypothetical protein